MKSFITVLLFCSIIAASHANNVEITNFTTSGSTINFDISWDNSWRSGPSFNDAVWVFLKEAPNGGPSWSHLNVTAITSVSSGYEPVLPADNVGFFLRRSSIGNGTSSISVSLTADGIPSVFRDIKVFAMEMVYIPSGPFYMGDGASHRSLTDPNDIDAPLYVVSEDGLTSNDYQRGDGTAVAEIPDVYPKGVDSFYAIKYAVTQQQYADFLNCLTRIQQDSLTIHPLINPTMPSGTKYVMDACENAIRCNTNIGTGPVYFFVDGNDNGVEGDINDKQSYNANGLTIEYTLAFLDWSGLRPFSAFEFEKACRGPLFPVALEHSHGSMAITNPGTIVNEGQDDMSYSNSGIDPGIYTECASRVGLNAPSTNSNRLLANAGYYGTVGYGSQGYIYNIAAISTSRLYNGEHGDGMITSGGRENVDNWGSYFGFYRRVQFKEFTSLSSYTSISASNTTYIDNYSFSIIGCRKL